MRNGRQKRSVIVSQLDGVLITVVTRTCRGHASQNPDVLSQAEERAWWTVNERADGRRGNAVLACGVDCRVGSRERIDVVSCEECQELDVLSSRS